MESGIPPLPYLKWRIFMTEINNEKLIDFIDGIASEGIDELAEAFGDDILLDAIDNDEFDTDDLSYSKIDAHNYIFDGKITIKDFCKVLEDTSEEKFEEHKGESETIAGFILEISGKFPKIGEKITFDIYTFTIEAIDRKRIKQLKVTRQHV